jgi:hypothetical protein
MAHRIFSPEMDAAIRAGYSSCTRVAAIAKQLGLTRNAVIGRARRLGLSMPANTKVIVIDREFVAAELANLATAQATYQTAKTRVDALRALLINQGRQDWLAPSPQQQEMK